jgi:hypothetical protein
VGVSRISTTASRRSDKKGVPFSHEGVVSLLPAWQAGRESGGLRLEVAAAFYGLPPGWIVGSDESDEKGMCSGLPSNWSIDSGGRSGSPVMHLVAMERSWAGIVQLVVRDGKSSRVQ